MNTIEIGHEDNWGGSWTQRKLDAFIKYVESYLTIMQKNPYWETIYFDGFAGSGSRKKLKSELFNELMLTPEDEVVYKGSAERVLSIKQDLKFNYYYFIDTNKNSIKKLEAKLNSLKSVEGKQIIYRTGDANNSLLALSNVLNTKKYSALIFLDPFGMQINWESIQSLKKTRSDIWILIPTGVIVNRLLDRKGKLIYLKKLESFFGLNSGEIKSAFYTTQHEDTLFGESEKLVKVIEPIEKIANLYLKRLNTIWEYTIKKPLVLENKRRVPIFHFVFASNNLTAVKIANQIIMDM